MSFEGDGIKASANIVGKRQQYIAIMNRDGPEPTMAIYNEDNCEAWVESDHAYNLEGMR